MSTSRDHNDVRKVLRRYVRTKSIYSGIENIVFIGYPRMLPAIEEEPCIDGLWTTTGYLADKPIDALYVNMYL